MNKYIGSESFQPAFYYNVGRKLFYVLEKRSIGVREAGNYNKKRKQLIALLLSITLISVVFPPCLPSMQAKADQRKERVTLTTAQGEFGGDHKIYCIDKGGLAIWGIAAAGDQYECHKPSEAVQGLTLKEQEYIFWGILSLQASKGNKTANDIITVINTNAQSQGKERIGKLVTGEDLKALIYSSTLRSKYTWLETAASNTEEYLKLAGLLGGSSSAQSGKKLPSVIADHTSISNAFQINQTDFTLHFDESGADADFIYKVPIEFSNNNGSSFESIPTDGWTYKKTNNSIIFSNPNPHPPKAIIKFVTEGTEYETTDSTYGSEQDFFDQCLQVWECVVCSGTHAGGRPPANAPWVHQRMVWLDIGTVPVNYYASLTASAPAQGGSSPFKIFRHSEDFNSTYNVQLYKYDYETGKPLEGARFVLYERFDDKDEIDTKKDGPVHIYAGGEPYASYHKDDPVIWDGFRNAGTVVTNEEGYGQKKVEHGYHYDKTFCNGHPAPVFVSVPEAEEDEETGELLNEDAIEAAKMQNRKMAREWEACEAACRNKAGGDFEGVHFHWIMDDVNQGEIEAAAAQGGEEGETPNGGNTAGAPSNTAYERSGCLQDMKDTYKRFTALKYSYAFTEFGARDGYIRHDLHSDDLPIEIITTDSSENGANAVFSGKYSNKEELDIKMPCHSFCFAAWMDQASNIISETVKEAKRRIIPKELAQRAKIIAQDIISCFADAVESKSFLFIDEDSGQSLSSTLSATPAVASLATPAAASLATPAAASLATPAAASLATPSAAPSITPTATPSNPSSPGVTQATPSAAALPSSAFVWPHPPARYQNPRPLILGRMNKKGAEDSGLFSQAYAAARIAESAGGDAEPGPSGHYSHCNDRDREGNAWRIYDHRTEGEFHINKKDLDLAAGETEQYSAYGDTQGDSTLEGAVYGLFAAEDISHPDGKTGIVYKANNLAAVATTDKNGDASFLVNTEAPGRCFDYASGCIVNTKDGWFHQAPNNLYLADVTFDDYTEDGNYQRVYRDNKKRNGSCWIGRPLLMGRYYIKELSRSEGYELSIGNKENDLTNLGQDREVKAPEPAGGYAVVTGQLFADEQTSDDGTGAGPNELFFSVRSKDTKDQSYDLILSELPEAAEFYRKEAGTKQEEVTAGTGVYEKILLTNPDGSPKYIRAEHEYQYPKYNLDGSPMMREIPVNYIAEQFRQVSVRPMDEELIKAVLNQAEGAMTPEENQEMLARPYSAETLPFVKGKVEAALRRNQRAVPHKRLSGGGYEYSSIDHGIFDRGVWEGETDTDGLSGVTPGKPAAYTVYGSPVQKISVAKQKQKGEALTVGDAVLSVLGYYGQNPYYSCGGIDGAEEAADSYQFTVYAGITGNPENFMVLGSDPIEDSIIFHAVKNDQDSKARSPRFCYVSYSNHPGYGAFGTYEHYKEETNGRSVVGRAELVTDAVATGEGGFRSKVIEENVYYQPGEMVRDSGGNLIQAFEYREIVKTQIQETEDVRWQKIPASRNEDGTCLLPVHAAYTDAFGVSHTNEGIDQTIEFKAVLKEKTIILSDGDAASLGDGFSGGEPMNSASYYVHVKKARAKAYLDASNLNLAGDNSYLITADLVYPGQESIFQDAGTRNHPAQVSERIIRQKIRIVKDITVSPDGTYPNNTNADTGHADEFTEGPAGPKKAAGALDNFRFKLYLKSNLERLYRDETGVVIWLDREGREIPIRDYQAAYPDFESFASAQKLYTRVSHRPDSLTAGSISNNVRPESVSANGELYSFGGDGQIKEEQNSGYTRLLESATEGKQGAVYNYEKFFDAVSTANHDKWDAGHPFFTSFKPIPYIREHLFAKGGTKKEYPAVHDNEKMDHTANTSEAAKANAEVSDAVRQFAITWYLDAEVKKQLQVKSSGECQSLRGGEDYQDGLYDRALKAAVEKAQNYLKPFFSYDLDEIYSIGWDGEADGGADKDKTTLEAAVHYETAKSDGDNGQSGDGVFYGTSAYLPYGVYVAVEQQPFSAELFDFYNKHYQTDRPREIILPSLYAPGGDKNEPEVFHPAYSYHSAHTPQELQSRYQIRFNREWEENALAGDLLAMREYVILGHNHDGDFEAYKYGLDTGRLKNIADWGCLGFTIAQKEFAPYKDIYQSENPACIYKSNPKVGEYYRFGSLSEQTGERDGVKAVTGSQTGCDGQYFAALVPWTVTEPAAAGGCDADQLRGCAVSKFHNTFYSARLRIEKLDSETGENILHDGALFALYSADREDEENSDGRVKFYERNTVIAGSKEFLEAMGARDITPIARLTVWGPPYKGQYYGTVSAGTPICSEKEQVILTDGQGAKTGRFKVCSTTKDVPMADPENDSLKRYGDQNTGYLETPEPIGAGCYVLAELKAPSGYTRSKPTAIEIYSDQTAYYLDGNKDSRVAAAVYEYPHDRKMEDQRDTARVYVNNTPIRLEVTKVKPDDAEAEYELNGRLEGSLIELKKKYGLEQLELAYNASGAYLGYGWRRGFLENLKQRQEAGEQIRLLYEDGVFTGRARLMRALETADDQNRYLPGAIMTLYDAVEVKASGDREDYGYTGVHVGRDRNGNVTAMYIQKGYAGKQIKYVLEKNDPSGSGSGSDALYTYGDQEDDKGGGTWIGKTVEREDTDILFFDLGDLEVLEREHGLLYGFDREGNRIQARDGQPVFALKNKKAYLEIICKDYQNLHYNSRDRVFDRVPEKTEFYHLNSESGRDSRVDPYSGMAYVTEESTGKTLVWPVDISYDAFGNVIAREKITTSRIASVNADTENEYTIGTWDGAANALQKRVNPVFDEHGLPVYYQRSDEVYQKGSPVYDRDGDYVRYRYDGRLRPCNSNAYEIQKNRDLLNVGKDPEDSGDDLPLYHRQGESFLIENTWTTGEKFPNDPFLRVQTDGQADVLKRVPAGTYILEELKAPEGYVKTMPEGVTVDETDKVQSVKAVDQAITVQIDKIDGPGPQQGPQPGPQPGQQPRLQPGQKSGQKSGTQPDSAGIDPSGRYSFKPVEGAALALYRAKRVRTDDTTAHPSGYYLEKTEETPAVWTALDENNQPVTVTAQWITGRIPAYFEAIPKGFYILEETEAPSGYVRASMEIEVRETGELQVFTLPNDHIKVEILKYIGEDESKRPMPNETPAELTLYEAVTDEHGIVTENGIPVISEEKEVDRWVTDDCREYTQVTDTAAYKKKTLFSLFAKQTALSGFTYNYEALFNEAGSSFDTFTWEVERTASRGTKTEGVFLTSRGERVVVSDGTIHFPEGMSSSDQEGFETGYKEHPDALTISWLSERRADLVETQQTDRAETVRQLWRTDEGAQTAICAVKTLTPEGKPGYVFDYRFNYRELKGPHAAGVVSYDTEKGTHRLDYLPLHENDRGYYVLVETKTPEGFAAVDPQAVIVEETERIQLYSLKNEPKYIEVEKIDELGRAVKNAELALYRAAGDGSLVMDPAHLAASWISGSGEQELKPHRITPIACGTYYLTETGAPYGYENMEPVRLVVDADSKPFVRAVNRVKKGVIRIEKSDSEEPEKKLSGAEFEIKNLDTGERFTLITDENGQAKSHPLLTGTTGEGGYFLPYRFRIQEITPPDAYKLNLSVHDFQFTDQQTETVLSYWYEIADEPTEISISKSDFNSGGLVKGAQLAVYVAKESEGIFEPDGEPLEEWVSDGTPHRIKGRLSAGRSYLLKELEAPPGYVCADPLLFTISDDGRKIVHVTNSRNKIWFQQADQFADAVEAVTIVARQAVETKMQLTDMETGEEVFIPSAARGQLEEEDGFQEGHRCEQREITHYSDGSSQISGRAIFRLRLGEGQTLPLAVRKPENVICRIETKEGEVIESWTVKNQAQGGFFHKIYNPEYESGCRIRVISEAGRHGAALQPGTIIKYEITYKNETNKIQNIPIKVRLDPQIDFMPANSTGVFREAAGEIVWMIREVEPGVGGSVIVAAAVRPEAKGELLTQAKAGNQTVTAQNLSAGEGSLTLVNSVSGTAAETLKEKEFTYRIELMDRDGEPLKGSVSYTGAQEGTLKSGGSVTLHGGEAVTFTGMAWGTGYEIRQEDGVDAEVSIIDSIGQTAARPVSAIFQNHKNDSSVREKFKKGETYVLVETTSYSDGTDRISDKLTFTLYENGAVGGLDINDKPTHVILSKTMLTGEKELPGASLILQDEGGAVIEQWISGERPHELIGVLEPGKTYTLTEQLPPDGCAYAPSITFTVSGDGAVDMIRMEDRPTQAELIKIDSTTGEGLSGALLQIRNLEGEIIDEWISDGTSHRVSGILNAGQTYCLVEQEPPTGYWREEPIYFTVSKDGTVDQIIMKDRPIRLWFEKHGMSEDGGTDLGLIGEAVIQIRDQADQVLTEFSTREGEKKEITGLLTAGERYRAVEIQAPPGYLLADPVEFTVPEKEDGQELIVVRMDDRKAPKKQAEKPKPPKTETPPPVVQKGYITAAYEKRLIGEGRIVIREGQFPNIPGLGEWFDPVLGGGAAVFLLGMAVLFLKIGRRKQGGERSDKEER